MSPKLMAAYTRLANIGLHVVGDEQGNVRVLPRAGQPLVLSVLEADALAYVVKVRANAIALQATRPTELMSATERAALAAEGHAVGASSPKPSSAR